MSVSRSHPTFVIHSDTKRKQQNLGLELSHPEGGRRGGGEEGSQEEGTDLGARYAWSEGACLRRRRVRAQ